MAVRSRVTICMIHVLVRPAPCSRSRQWRVAPLSGDTTRTYQIAQLGGETNGIEQTVRLRRAPRQSLGEQRRVAPRCSEVLANQQKSHTACTHNANLKLAMDIDDGGASGSLGQRKKNRASVFGADVEGWMATLNLQEKGAPAPPLSRCRSPRDAIVLIRPILMESDVRCCN